MRNLETITQAAVRELIQQQRKPRLHHTPEEKPTVWRQTGSGPRYVQIPAIHEQDEQTGLALQQMIESEGLTAQAIVREAIALRAEALCAIALRQAYKAGRLVEIENPSLDVEEETDVASRQESEAIVLQDRATELEVVTPEQPALFVLQTDSQPTERRVLPLYLGKFLPGCRLKVYSRVVPLAVVVLTNKLVTVAVVNWGNFSGCIWRRNIVVALPLSKGVSVA